MNRLRLFLFVTLVIGVGLSRPVASAAIDDIGSGQILFSSGVSAVHVRSRAKIEVSGLIATVNLTQKFRNDTGDWQEATYLLPLQDSSAVSVMTMTMGTRVLRAEIREKEEARQIYQKARSEGKKAGLVEHARPNLFRQKVANIAPGEEINVEIGFIQVIDYQHGEFVFRMPMTLTPRYDPATGSEKNMLGSSMGAANSFTRGLPGATKNPISIVIDLDAGFELAGIQSPYHDVAVNRNGARHQVTFADGEVSMDRDFELVWKPVAAEQPRAAVFRNQVAGDDYVMLMMLPPDQVEDVTPLARDVIFVVDTSGSMQGTSIDQARESLRQALTTLRAQDRFNILEFNSYWSSLFEASQPVDSYSLSVAGSWVDQLSADGGTEMLPALTAAMSSEHDDNYVKHIIFVTDGAVSNEQDLFRQIDRQLGKARLFPVGIGSAPNTHFMRQAAKFGRGSYTHIASVNEVGNKMQRLLTKIDSPVATAIEVQWPFQVESYPRKIPDLYLGEPLIVVARSQNVTGSVLISGQTAGADWHQNASLADDRKGNVRHQGVGTLWARRKLEALNDAEIRGVDPALIRKQILEVALKHQLVSRYTSLVAVEEIIERLPHEKLQSGQVPNVVPKGQVRYPGTSTGARLSILFGLAALLLLVAVRLRRRKQATW